MRRSEFEITAPALWQEILKQGHWGTLSLVDTEGWPYAVPMNYAWIGESLVLHGSPSGKRGQCLEHKNLAQFTVVRDLSFIPSDVFGSELACGATEFFQSVMLWGHLRPVENTQEKATLLQGMMERLQPQGGHAPILAEDPRYTAALRGVGVWALTPERVSAKFKLGQNLGKEKAARLADFLEKRGEALDLATAQCMRNRK